jgi:hypothetical protein
MFQSVPLYLHCWFMVVISGMLAPLQLSLNNQPAELCVSGALVFNLFFVRIPPDVISLQLCTPAVVGV